ncbi:MAG: serine protease [Candidatus Paceibacterota bacterium]
MSEKELGRLGLFISLFGTIFAALSTANPILLKIGLGLVALGFVFQVFVLEGPSLRYKKERLLRILVNYRTGKFAAGSGFFINKNGELLTCFHVVFGAELNKLRLLPNFISINIGDEHNKLEQYFKNTILNLEIELPNGIKKGVELKNFNEKYDIAILKLKEPLKNIKYFKIDFEDTPYYGDDIIFCGFQLAHGYSNDKFPFAVNVGIISSFPETTVGGDSYQHLQINSINLGGNSGAPLFRKGKKNVIGIVNGNMNMGNNNVVLYDSKNNKNITGSIIIPLSIAYATSLKLLKQKANLF